MSVVNLYCIILLEGRVITVCLSGLVTTVRRHSRNIAKKRNKFILSKKLCMCNITYIQDNPQIALEYVALNLVVNCIKKKDNL